MDGQERFFCCWICARAYLSMTEEVKGRTGWPRLDTLHLIGDFQGREGAASYEGQRFSFRFSFDPETGELRHFSGEFLGN